MHCRRHMLKPPNRKKKKKWQKEKKSVGWICVWVSELNMTWVLSHIVPEKKKKKHRSRRKICCDQLLPPDAVLTPSSTEQEKPVTSCSTSLVTLTRSQSHLQKGKEKKKKKYYHVYIYLRNVKAFLPFHVWILWTQIFFFFFLQSRYCSFLVVWMDAWLLCVTFPVYVNCECMRVRGVMVGFTKTEWMISLSVRWNA